MEDGSNGVLSETTDHLKNGALSPVMANFPKDTTISSIIETKISDDLTITKINGDKIDCNDYNSSESDALIIDESIPKQKTKRKRSNVNKKATKSSHENQQQHYNPYFNESLFELSQQHQNILTTATGTVITPTITNTTTITPVEISPNNTNSVVGVFDKTDGELSTNTKISLNKSHKHKRLKKKNSPKLKEYTQYLGLKPSIQFKCSKCTRSGFQSLNLLNEHLVQCNNDVTRQESSQQQQDNSSPSSSSFKLTRKVFLCSACGTYYENWNLYLHMIEVHRRYLCLYCLGMFSVLDDLCTHIQIKHNVEPGYKENLQEFFNTYSEPCYIVCCNCGKLFNEQENFFYHTCTELITNHNNNNNRINKLTTNKTTIKPTIQIEQHITGDSIIGDNQEKNNELKIDDNHVINNEFEPLKNQKEILYSSDSELNFKGFDDNGEAIFLNKTNQLEKTHEEESAAVEEEEEEDEEIVDNDVEDEEDDDDEDVYDEEDEDDDDESKEIQEEHIETRKVPKLSLKLKLGSFPEIEQHTNDDSDDDSDDNDENQQTINEDDKNEDVFKYESYRDDEFVENDQKETIEKQEEIVGKQEEKELGGGGEDKEEEDNEKSTEFQIAGPDIPIVELQLEQPLDKFDIRLLIQKCLNATAPTCIYCNHARKISVNGKRLGLHAIAQHRYSAIVSSITAEELIPESFITRIKDNLNNLDNVYFNLESNPTRIDEGVTFSHIFECFQCRYSTTIHKELYLHNRKSHTKNLLLCIMCKLNFYSYSELICHLCPGAYIIDYDVQFRCCMCVSDDIPSAFRLMVHLRKRHHVCDVCLEMCHNQYKLSNHVWKHKLHHFCYRCGIAYRNKPDITRHLFWKHGTESVLCKKCLQKKWPHVYHFCVPPTSFSCDECNLTFSRAVSLKVHKRIHNDEKPHCCTIDDCQERFISKKLLAKHELRHREPPPEEIQQIEQQQIDVEENNETIKENHEIQVNSNDKQEDQSFDNDEKQQEKIEEKPVQKPKIDVYDLPELNLSESDSSDSEVETEKKNENPTNDQNKEENPIDNNKDDGDDNINKESIFENCNNDNEIPILEEPSPIDENNLNTDVVIENIWDNFKNYQANKEKFDSLLTEVESKHDQATAATTTTTTIQQNEQQDEEQQQKQEQGPLTLEIALLDHDYCIDPENKPDVTFTEVKPDLSQSVDHDYCFGKNTTDIKDTTTVDVDVEIEKTTSATVTTTTTTNTTTTITNAVNDDVVETKSPQKQISNSSSSNSSSDSDSSSCSCGPNCSCSSSSDSSSSTSDSSDSDSSTEEGRKRQQLRREKRRQRTNNKDNSNHDKKEKIIDIISTTTNATTTLTTTVTTTTIMTTTTTITNHLLLNDMPIHESDLETTESETDEEFYDKQPHLIAKKILEEKRNQLLAGIESITTPNGSLLEQPSRSTTPNLPIEVEQQEQQHQQQQDEEQRSKKKSKSKKKKKKKKLDNNREFQSINIPTSSNYYHQYYQQQSQTIAPITLSLNRNSPIPSPSINLSSTPLYAKVNNDLLTHQQRSSGSVDDDANLRASKRRRVPNKFYGYSSDEEEMPKWRKTDPTSQIPVQQQQFVVPPITIKTGGQISGIQPFSISKSTPNQMKFNSKQSQLQQYYQQYHYGQQQQQQQQQQQRMPPVRLKQTKNHQIDDGESEPESNDSVSGGESRIAPKVNPDALYCYCKCPYDEVSEMIGCDAPDCKIEWFHFECVGIMVPPKGHWYCPECRKKRQQKREALKLKAKLQQQQQQSPT